jgi:4-methyl-5(b-hydroxyethyl)-thiazole monophosphate biosynthesis
MTKKALSILARGFEEIEAITPIDLLKRAGVHVTVAGVGGISIKGGRTQITVLADKNIEEIHEDFDAIILPGGMPGAANLAASEKVNEIIKEAHKKNKIIAAICASPAVVLTPLGILKNKAATCFPGMEKDFNATTQFKNSSTIVDGNIITSQAAGTAFDFSIKIIEKLLGEDAAKQIRHKTFAL